MISEARITCDYYNANYDLSETLVYDNDIRIIESELYYPENFIVAAKDAKGYTFFVELVCGDGLCHPHLKTDSEIREGYGNPIDEYFLPRIATAFPEVARREYQDTYRGIWKSEFENIVQWVAENYTYQQDLDALSEYKKALNNSS